MHKLNHNLCTVAYIKERVCVCVFFPPTLTGTLKSQKVRPNFSRGSCPAGWNWVLLLGKMKCIKFCNLIGWKWQKARTILAEKPPLPFLKRQQQARQPYFWNLVDQGYQTCAQLSNRLSYVCYICKWWCMQWKRCSLTKIVIKSNARYTLHQNNYHQHT